MKVEQLASLPLKRKRARGKLHAFLSVQFKMRASKECAREREREERECSIHYKFRRRPPTSVIYNGKRIQRPEEACPLESNKFCKFAPK